MLGLTKLTAPVLKPEPSLDADPSLPPTNAELDIEAEADDDRDTEEETEVVTVTTLGGADFDKAVDEVDDEVDAKVEDEMDVDGLEDEAEDARDKEDELVTDDRVDEGLRIALDDDEEVATGGATELFDDGTAADDVVRAPVVSRADAFHLLLDTDDVGFDTTEVPTTVRADDEDMSSTAPGLSSRVTTIGSSSSAMSAPALVLIEAAVNSP